MQTLLTRVVTAIAPITVAETGTERPITKTGNAPTGQAGVDAPVPVSLCGTAIGQEIPPDQRIAFLPEIAIRQDPPPSTLHRDAHLHESYHVQAMQVPSVDKDTRIAVGGSGLQWSPDLLPG